MLSKKKKIYIYIYIYIYISLYIYTRLVKKVLVFREVRSKNEVIPTVCHTILINRRVSEVIPFPILRHSVSAACFKLKTTHYHSTVELQNSHKRCSNNQQDSQLYQ